MEKENDKELHKLVDKWIQRVSLSQGAHYDAGNYYETLFLVLGVIVIVIVIVIVLSAGIGSAEVLVPSATVAELGADKVKAGSGVISLLIAILAGLQTFLKFSQKSERHRVAGAKYGDVRRSLEEMGVLSSDSTEKEEENLHKIKTRMDSLALESPELPSRVMARHGGTDAL